MSAIIYHPELNEPKPNTIIDARLSCTGRHWYLKTKIKLSGRGIVFLENIDGINRYKVTDRAFKDLENKWSVSIKCYLD